MDLIAIGTVRTAWGLGGWVKLSSYSGEWDHFASLKTVSLKSMPSGRIREYVIEGFRFHQGAGQFKFSGVDSPESAKTLSGTEILVSRKDAAALDEDEWYIADLIGLRVLDVDGNQLGQVTSTVSTSDDLLEVETPAGKKFLVPFRKEFVGEPDIERGTLVLTALWVME
jgi:16S rRNA processing protein RimM